MKRHGTPGLEDRRAVDFERELAERARAWLPFWSLDETEPDFGMALLRIAARFNSEVAERLDQAGDKMALGFLDWLALRPEAARPARMPVAFELAETAPAPVLAQHPIKMQVDAAGATVTFETETSLRIVPGTLELVVGVDEGEDQYFLPPPGLSALDPIEPLPTEWRIKNFAAPGSTTLQLDPGLGLAEGMLVGIAGEQYEILSAKDDLVTIGPAVPEGAGFAGGSAVTRVQAFVPFGSARNRQEHILYIGDSELLDLEDAAVIEVRGVTAIDDWQYWGRNGESDEEPRWQPLHLVDEQVPGAVRLSKPKGEIIEFPIGDTNARWIRAWRARSDQPIATDGVQLRINPRDDTAKDPEVNWETTLRPEVFVNSTPSPPRDFYPLGREPRLFDTLYLGSRGAFSKKGATAWLQFDLSDAVFQSVSAINAGAIGFVLAAIDKRGALHLLKLDANNIVTRLPKREPMKPGEGVDLIPEIAPVMWMSGNNLNVAAAAIDKIHVWSEVSPASEQSKWKDYGSPAPSGGSNQQIVGLAMVEWGALQLVALRGKRLSTLDLTSGDLIWTSPGVGSTLAPPANIDRIFQVRHADEASYPTKLLAVLESEPDTFHSIDDGEEPEKLLFQSAVAVDVAPFALQRNAAVLRVVASNAAHTAFLASDTGQAGNGPISPNLENGFMFTAGTVIGGQIEGGHFTAYAIAATGSGQRIAAWQPFRPKLAKILFQHELGPDLEELQGTTLVTPGLGTPLAILPGKNRGDIFAAKLGGVRTAVALTDGDLRSALAVSPPSDPVSNGDFVGVETGGNLEVAEVEGRAMLGRGNHADTKFFWLKPWLDLRNVEEQDVLVFKTSVAAPLTAEVLSALAPFTLQFDGSVAALPKWILVDDGPGTTSRNPIEVIDFDANQVATVDRLAAPLNTHVAYWESAPPMRAKIFPALATNPSAIAWTIAALGERAVHFPGLDPLHQRIIAYTADPAGYPDRLAFQVAWSGPPPLAFEMAVDLSITGWASLFGDSTANPALSWEYWDGGGWAYLPIGTPDDTTNALRNSGFVKFDIPNDMAETEWAGKTNYWIRARLIGGDYGKEKVTVRSKPLDDGTTEQTVDRTTVGIQPPYALNVGVTYALDTEAVPKFLKTKDNGSLRDQSDANRMAGTDIEIFTPLKLALARFDAQARGGEGAAEECLPDCECPDGAPSLSPYPHGVAAPAVAGDGSSDPAASSGGRALYLGFDAKLLGGPINVLFAAAQEQPNDAFAPLRVAALIGGAFVPIIASDETRALGETGLLKMNLAEAPVETELFGKSLSWLRLTPGPGGGAWEPAIGGVYLNAVWARSAETMTRELVGASAGQPRLTLLLARPPLLRDSLELRVREPLGEEERNKLREVNPQRVMSAVEDLPGDWVLWLQVDDPLDCDSGDRVYALDEATGAIRFGDGRHGAIPPAGADSIVAFKYERYEPGAAGFVPANFVEARRELNLVSPVESVEAVLAAGPAAGGLATESADRVLNFAPARMRHRGRAVSARDYEDLARQRSAEVVQAHASVRAGAVRLVVVMRGTDPQPNQAQRRELKRMLLEASPPALAGRGMLTIVGPNVRRFRVELRLQVATLDHAGAVADHVKALLAAFFDSERGGARRDGWPLGASPREEDIAEALLDVADLESIDSVRLVDADGPAARPWPAALGPRDLAMLAEDGVRFTFLITEAAE